MGLERPTWEDAGGGEGSRVGQPGSGHLLRTQPLRARSCRAVPPNPPLAAPKTPPESPVEQPWEAAPRRAPRSPRSITASSSSQWASPHLVVAAPRCHGGPHGPPIHARHEAP